MELFQMILDYFQVNFLDCSTFPELLNSFFNVVFAVFLVYLIFKAYFAVVWRIGSGKL